MAATKLAMPVVPNRPGVDGGQDVAAYQAGRDVAGEEQIVEFEETAQREERHQAPNGARGGQAVQARSDRTRGFGGLHSVPKASSTFPAMPPLRG